MKYGREQVRAMAQRALQARDLGDERWLHLVMQIAIRCEISFNTVHARIEELAR